MGVVVIMEVVEMVEMAWWLLSYYVDSSLKDFGVSKRNFS
jgi:hypothetical protein